MRLFDYIDIALMFVALIGMMRRRRGSFLGKHVSKPLARLIGESRTLMLRTGLILVSLALSFSNFHIATDSAFAVYWLWAIDDAWFSDDDDDRKRWDGVKARLRKCKPVMKRAVQRWKPESPRVPVPA